MSACLRAFAEVRAGVMNQYPLSHCSYELVFEGPVDASLDTAWEIKYLFMSELGFDVAKATRFFNSDPIILQSSQRKSDLQSLLQKLQKAGAVVRLRQRQLLPQTKKSLPDVSSILERVHRQGAGGTKTNKEDEQNLDEFFDHLTRSEVINTKRVRVVDGVEKRESTEAQCRRDLQF